MNVWIHVKAGLDCPDMLFRNRVKDDQPGFAGVHRLEFVLNSCFVCFGLLLI